MRDPMILHLSISGVAVASGPPKSVGAFRVAADEALVVTHGFSGRLQEARKQYGRLDLDGHPLKCAVMRGERHGPARRTRGSVEWYRVIRRVSAPDTSRPPTRAPQRSPGNP